MVTSSPNTNNINNSLHYENVEIKKVDINSPYENVVINSNISNSSPYPQSPRTRIKTYIHSSHKERY